MRSGDHRGGRPRKPVNTLSLLMPHLARPPASPPGRGEGYQRYFTIVMLIIAAL